MLDPTWGKIYLTFAVIVGVVMCFHGYRIFRLVLALLGVVLGAGGAGAVGYQLSGGNMAVAVFCGVIGALLGGVLLVALYHLGLFFFGAAFGAAIGAGLMASYGPQAQLVVMAVLAAIGAIAALLLQRVIIIAGTALEGSSLITTVVWIIYSHYPLSKLNELGRPKMSTNESYAFLGIWAALALAGMIVQFLTTAEPPPHAEPTEPSPG